MLDFGSSSSSDESNSESGSNEANDDDENNGELFTGCNELNLRENKDDSEEELFEKEFQLHKRNYYINKLKYPEMTK